uniref:Protein CcmA, bactofilin family n=1 Tax=Candidatus Kentrum sp. LPFa TaxID=2126335 RepID=A0A450VYI7_9GAMM|nr:MAG: protein CcmA, bactofilin family [Candidatus Kentron sp. LPFa]VFK25721.1 MAG: protein CcmA, bactofilin family [Candidatus Kentron sp. LPFa]
MNRKKRKNIKITTLIGHDSELRGDIWFSGGLHVDGSIFGNVIAKKSTPSLLTLSEQGTIQGDVKVPQVVISGTVIGNVHSYGHIELSPSARITGSVYYTAIEMAMGAEVNGNLVHKQNEKDAESFPSPGNSDDPFMTAESPLPDSPSIDPNIRLPTREKP